MVMWCADGTWKNLNSCLSEQTNLKSHPRSQVPRPTMPWRHSNRCVTHSTARFICPVTSCTGRIKIFSSLQGFRRHGRTYHTNVDFSQDHTGNVMAVDRSSPIPSPSMLPSSVPPSPSSLCARGDDNVLMVGDYPIVDGPVPDDFFGLSSPHNPRDPRDDQSAVSDETFLEISAEYHPTINGMISTLLYSLFVLMVLVFR